MTTAFHSNARLKDVVITRLREAQQDGDLAPDIVSTMPAASRLHAMLRIAEKEKALDVVGLQDWFLNLLAGLLEDLPDGEGADLVLKTVSSIPVGASLEALEFIVGLACLEHPSFGLPRQVLDDFDLRSEHGKLVSSLRASLHNVDPSNRLFDTVNIRAMADVLDVKSLPELNDDSRAWLRFMRSGQLTVAEVKAPDEQTPILAAGLAMITIERSLWARTCLLTRATRMRVIVPQEERALRRAGRLLEVKRVYYQDLAQIGIYFRSDAECWSRELCRWLIHAVRVLPRIDGADGSPIRPEAFERFTTDDQPDLPSIPMPDREHHQGVRPPSRALSRLMHLSRVGFGLVFGLLAWLLGWSAFALLPNGPVIEILERAWGMNGFERTGIAAILFLIIFVVFSVVGRLILISARWRGGDGWWVKQRHGKFVLLLRSFKDDFRIDTNRPGYLTFGWQIGRRSELHQLAEALSPIGPVIAVADPKRRGLVGGVATLKFSEQDWWIAVADLIEQAELVVMLPSYSDFIRSEMRLARRIVPPQKLLFFLPPTLTQEKVEVRNNDFVDFVADGRTIRPVTRTSAQRNNEVVSFNQFFSDLLKHQIGVRVDPVALPGRGGFLWCQHGWRARRLDDATEPDDFFGSKTASYFEALTPVYKQFGVSVNWREVYRKRWWAAVILIIGGVLFSEVLKRILGLQ